MGLFTERLNIMNEDLIPLQSYEDTWSETMLFEVLVAIFNQMKKLPPAMSLIVPCLLCLLIWVNKIF